LISLKSTRLLEALAGGAKSRHIVALVFEAPSKECFQEGVRPLGPLALSKRFAHLQRRPVPAVQEVGKVCCRQNQASSISTHIVFISEQNVIVQASAKSPSGLPLGTRIA
jgi:hypothetical protein